VHLDLRGKCNWTEHFVIGTVEEGHPMKPIHDALYEQLRARKVILSRDAISARISRFFFFFFLLSYASLFVRLLVHA
jgi:hypothetical protein